MFFHIDNADSIPCPFEQSWNFEKSRQPAKFCQPEAFQHCSSSSTFELSYNNRCPNNQSKTYFKGKRSSFFKYVSFSLNVQLDVRATCFARFTDGNVNYVVARSIDQQRFVCFVSYHVLQNLRQKSNLFI